MRHWRRCVWLVAIGVLGLVLRLWVLSAWPGMLNADEMVTGIGALEAVHGRFDVVIPGNAYTANFESYLMAPVVAIAGLHVVPFKLMAVTLWALACWAVYCLTRRVGGATSASLAAGLLWVVPGALLVLSTRAYLAYPGGLLLTAASLVWLARIADLAEPDRRISFVSGLLLGLTTWAHPMYLAVLGPATLVVGLRHRRCWSTWWMPAALGAALADFPWIVWNIAHGFPSLHGEAGGTYGTYTSRFKGFFVEMLPRGLGLRNYSGTDWTIGPIASALAVAVVLLVAAFGGIHLARRGWSGRVVSVPLFVSWPIMATFGPLGFVLDARYCIVIAAPMFCALGTGLDAVIQSVSACRRRPLAAAAGAAWLGVLVLPYQWQFVGRDWIDPNWREAAVTSRLRADGVRWVSGSYWGVLPVTFLSDGQIESSVVAPWAVRYPEMQRRVEARPPEQVTFIFRPEDENLASLPLPLDRYARIEVGGFILYEPTAGN